MNNNSANPLVVFKSNLTEQIFFGNQSKYDNCCWLNPTLEILLNVSHIEHGDWIDYGGKRAAALAVVIFIIIFTILGK